MAVELLGRSKINEQLALQEAASAGLKSMDHIIRFVSHQQNQTVQPDCKQLADFTASNFKKVISILNRTGHARFRRSPVQVSNSKETQPLPQTPVEKVESPALTFDFVKSKVDVPKNALSLSANSSSSFMSSITGEGSVSNGKQTSSMGLPPRPPVSAGKPPLAGKRCRDPDGLSGRISSSSKCHCNNRKSRVKRVIKVPAISSKVAEIPADEYSWRKYGQKPIKGSTYPRGYYRCSSVRGCPARKHVERATNDPAMLIVTYEGDHRHEIAGTGAGVGCAGERMMEFGSTGQMKESK